MPDRLRLPPAPPSPKAASGNGPAEGDPRPGPGHSQQLRRLDAPQLIAGPVYPARRTAAEDPPEMAPLTAPVRLVSNKTNQ